MGKPSRREACFALFYGVFRELVLGTLGWPILRQNIFLGCLGWASSIQIFNQFGGIVLVPGFGRKPRSQKKCKEGKPSRRNTHLSIIFVWDSVVIFWWFLWAFLSNRGELWMDFWMDFWLDFLMIFSSDLILVFSVVFWWISVWISWWFSGWFPVLIFDGFPSIFLKDFWRDFLDGFLNRFLVRFLDWFLNGFLIIPVYS